jgi:lysophospholipase L1-like esterase
MNFYFFGDSICFGQFVAPRYVFVNLLTEALESFSPEEWIIQNPSVNGRTTRQALEDMNFQIQSNPVDCLYVQFGMNDCNHWANDFGGPRVHKSAFAANLSEIVERARRSNIQLIFLATNHPSSKVTNFPHLSFSYQQVNAEYNNIIREVAINKNVILIDHEQWWHTHAIAHNQPLSKLLLSDGIHLSKQGHVVYAQCARQVIIPALQKQIDSFKKNKIMQGASTNVEFDLQL